MCHLQIQNFIQPLNEEIWKELHASGSYYIKQGVPRLGKAKFIYSLSYGNPSLQQFSICTSVGCIGVLAIKAEKRPREWETEEVKGTHVTWKEATVGEKKKVEAEHGQDV